MEISDFFRETTFGEFEKVVEKFFDFHNNVFSEIVVIFSVKMILAQFLNVIRYEKTVELIIRNDF